MTTVLLVGLDEAEVDRLEAVLDSASRDSATRDSALRSAPAWTGLRFVRAVDGEAPADLDRRTSVALVSGADDAGLESRVAAAGDLGLPVMFLMPGLIAPRVTPGASRGDVAVDYLFPPFRPTELTLRLTLLAGRGGGDANGSIVQQGEIRIDLERYEVTVAGRRVDLTYKEYELLRVLASNPGHVYSREALLQTVWEYDYYGGTRTVDVHIRRLRSKINDMEHRFIETVWNVGYRFRAPDQAV